MDKVMDRVVETQVKIYNAICYRSFVFLVTGILVYKYQFVCRDDSQVPGQVWGLKTTWSGKLSDSYTTAVYIYYKTGRRNCRCWWDIKPGHKLVIQPLSRTSPGEDLRPGLVLQDRTIVCWLNVASDLVTAKKERLYSYSCVRSHNRYLYTLFRSSYNTLAGLCISASYTSCFYTT